MTYIERLHIDRELVLEFFLVFSRIEFSLKLAGFVTGGENSVSPDWGGFIRKVSETFILGDDEEVATAIYYYIGHPPQKQVLKNGSLDWMPVPRQGSSDIEDVLMSVRRVRNNLFHGGKYNAEDHQEVARNEELLRQGILILKSVIREIPSVLEAYNGQ